MDVVAFGARALLVMVFVVAAAGKLVDRDGARRALSDFRVPAALVPPVSWLLPLSEFAVAVLLLAQPLAREAAAAAALLLALFMCGIGAAMHRGEAPDCNCFGQIGSKPAGRETLQRNAVLMVPAIFVALYGPGVNPGSWFKPQTSAEITILALVIIGLALAVAIANIASDRRLLQTDLAQAQSTLALLPAGLPIGVAAPAFSLPGTDGATVTLADLLARGRPIALTFVSPTCMPCRYMFPDISGWQQSLSERLTIVLIAHGTVDDARELERNFGLGNLLADPDATVFRDYRGSATPSMVMINIDGKIQTRIRASQGVVEAAIRTALNASPPRTAGATSGTDGTLIQVERRSGRGVQQPA